MVNLSLFRPLAVDGDVCYIATIQFSCKCKSLVPLHCKLDNDAMCEGEGAVLLIRYFSLLQPCQSCHDRGRDARDEARMASTAGELASIARAVKTWKISLRAQAKLVRAATARDKYLELRAVQESESEQENILILKNWVWHHAHAVLKMHLRHGRAECLCELRELQAREMPMVAARINRELAIAFDVEAFGGPWHRVGNEWRQRNGMPGMTLDIRTSPAGIRASAGFGVVPTLEAAEAELALSPPIPRVTERNSMGAPPRPRKKLP